MPITCYGPTGLDLYVMFNDASDRAINMTEGASLKAGTYTVADAAMVTATLPAGKYSYRILEGLAASKSANDALVGTGELVFSGTAELPLQDANGRVSANVTAMTIADGATIQGGLLIRSTAGAVPALNIESIDGTGIQVSGESGSDILLVGGGDTLNVKNALASVTTIINRLGVFTGSGVNTVLGFLRSLMSKDAEKPSDLDNTTYGPADHSLEATAERTAGIAAGGPAAQEHVPKSRTAKLQMIAGRGLVSIAPHLSLKAGNALLLHSADFTKDLDAEQDLGSILAIAIAVGTAGGITFNSPTGTGVDHAEAKFMMAGVTAGEYVISVEVQYKGSSGSRTALINVTVV